MKKPKPTAKPTGKDWVKPRKVEIFLLPTYKPKKPAQ